MNCKYYFNINPNEGYDYDEIINLLQELDKIPDNISDILFSENENRRNSVIEKLDKIRFDYKEKSIGLDKSRQEEAVLTGFDFEYGNSDTLTIQLFLSSDKCQIGGNRLYTPMDIEALKDKTIKEYVNQGLSQEDAEKKLKNQFDHYKTIESDARLIHELISFNDLSGKSVGSFFNKFLDSASDDQKVRLSKSVIDSFYYQLSDKFWKDIILKDYRGNLKDSVKKGFNIQSDLSFDGGEKQKLSGHIDYLLVDKNGHLHLYNFVTSSKLEWNYDKRTFYELKLLTLKRMLQNNGINVDGIALHNVPIYIKYDDNNESILDINLGTDRQIYIDDVRAPQLLDKDYQLGKFIKSDVTFKFGTDDEITNKLRGAFSAIFPSDINLDIDGLHKSVKEWIKSAPETDPERNQLVIKYIGEPERQYEVYINGKKVADIKSNLRRENNPEIIQVVLDHINEMYDNRESIAFDMYNAIYSAHLNGTTNNKKFRQICEHLTQYIYDRDENGKSNWELIDDLLQYHILLFKKGDNVDVVYLAPTSLDLEIDFGKGQHNILGKVKPDISSIPMRGTHGNLYTVLSLLILNEYLPKLNLEEFKLGKIKVLNLNNNSSLILYQYNIEHVVKKYFKDIINAINERDNNLGVKNNFVNAKFRDPIVDIIEQLKVLGSYDSDEVKLLKSNNFDEALKDVQNNKTKELQLRKLIDFITNSYFTDYTHEEILSILNGSKNVSKETYAAAGLYKTVSDAYLLYSNLSLEYDEIIDPTQRNVMKPAYISSRNARLIVNNYRAMLNAMSDEINLNYEEFIYNPVNQYYKEIGYTALLNSTVGMLHTVYKNMFEKDPDGKLTLSFKNPYINEGNQSYLTDSERKFLKRAIFLFNKMLHPEYNFVDENDKAFIDKVNSDKSFLWVPLQRASSDSQFLTHWKNKINRFTEYIRNKKNILDELQYKIDDFTREAKSINLADDANVFGNLHIGNKFNLSEESRERYIREKGADYFETNVEDLLIDVLGEVVEVDKTNSFLIGTKAILFLLLLMKDDYKLSNDIVNKELQYINDYLKVNVFKKTLSKGWADKMLSALMPIRKFVVDVNLAGNLVGFFRDLENGFIENYWRTVSKLNTDITKSDLTKAYIKFFGEATFTNPMRVNLLNKLCCEYRISNVDLARITERLKSGRAGMSNYENWLYATLRAPDFLHRMTLFMAKCIHDGIIDPDDDSKSAFYIEDNKLKYDWRKDKRFEHLAKGDKSDQLYHNELGFYTTLIDTYNALHPDKEPIPYYDEQGNLSNLPRPYTEGEIQSIKEAGSNIYGDYDRSNKALGEFHAIGLVFAMYTTWMNGIIANTIMKPGLYSPNQRIWTQMEDAEGKLYKDPNNLGNFVHESDLKDTDPRTPVYEEEIQMAQGLFPALNSMYYYLREGGLPALKEYWNASPQTQALMKDELIDLMMSLMWLILYKLIFDPAYKEHKKQAEGEQILTNFITEVIYKSTRASFDTFKGPWNIIQYLGDQMNPPLWQVPTTLISDTSKWLFGDKTFYQILTGNFGFARAFRDTYSMYKRDVIQ